MTGKVCVGCQIEMRPKENGVGALMMTGPGEYQLHDADLWVCPACGIQVLLGFGRKPIAEHYQPDFAAAVAGYKTLVRYWSSRDDQDRGRA